MKRALRREMLKEMKNRKWQKFVSAGIGLAVGTAIVFGFSAGLVQFFWKTGLVDSAVKVLKAPIPMPEIPIVEPQIEEPPQELTWEMCFDLSNAEHPRWNGFLIPRCLWTKALNMIWN